MYLEVRDDVAALIFAQRRADALNIDVRDGDPAFQRAFERLIDHMPVTHGLGQAINP